MNQEIAHVIRNEKLGPDYYRIGLECHTRYLSADPGQFVMLRLGDGCDPLLRRPFSIHRLAQNRDGGCTLEILYKVVGKGTQTLAGYDKGDRVDLLGPLGKGFTVPKGRDPIILIAGGIGVAPMLFLVETFRRKEIDLAVVRLFLGGRTKSDLLCLDRFARLGLKVEITTEDGSGGEKGLIIEPFEKALAQAPPKMVYACGPMGMLSSVAGLSTKYRIRCQISTETIMACGIGACLGCAMVTDKKSGKYLHACLDGPVFEADTVMRFL